MRPPNSEFSAVAVPATARERLDREIGDVEVDNAEPLRGQPDLLGAALGYAARGWPVFPLHNPIVRGGTTSCSCGRPHLGEDVRNIGKHPRTRNGFKDATTDPEVIRAWWARWPEANIGVACGPVAGPDLHLAVVDIDNDADAETVQDWMLPATLTTTTGRGQHLYFLSKSPVPHGQRDGVLVRAAGGGYVVAPPSLHFSGGRYAFVDETVEPALVNWEADLDDGEDEADDGVVELLRAPAESRLFQERIPGRDRSPNEFRCIVSLIADGLGDDDIVSVMQATPAGVRMRERGTDWGRKQVVRLRKKLKDRIANRYAIATPSGKLRIIDKQLPNERWMQRGDFLLSFPKVQRSMALSWFDAAATPRHPSVYFKPEPPSSKATRQQSGHPFNLFAGWAFEPGTGSWDRYEYHVRKHICAGDDAAAEYHLDFAAHLVQRPEERPSVCILHRSDEHGTGKDVFNSVPCNLLKPQHTHRTFDINTLTGKFNKHLSLSLVVVGEEISFAPNAEQAEKLKGLTSMPSIPFQPKGVDIIQMPFYARIFYSSNQVDPLRLAPGDRRVSMFDVPAHEHTRNVPWFKELYRELEGGGYRGLLGHLMNRDISRFCCRTPFDTKAKRASILRQMDPLDAFICTMLEESENNAGPHNFSWIAASDFQCLLGVGRDGLELVANEPDRYAPQLDAWRECGRFHRLYAAQAKSLQQRVQGEAVLKGRLTKLGFTAKQEGPREARGNRKWNFYDPEAREKAKKELVRLYGYEFP